MAVAGGVTFAYLPVWRVGIVLAVREVGHLDHPPEPRVRLIELLAVPHLPADSTPVGGSLDSPRGFTRGLLGCIDPQGVVLAVVEDTGQLHGVAVV